MPVGDLQLDWLRAFVLTIDSGSLTAAAPRLHRSQSAVSMQLRKLEDAAGHTLLSRGPKHLELTAAGRELMPHARLLLEQHDRAVVALQGSALLGSVSLGVPDDYALSYLAPVVKGFVAKHPDVEIMLDCTQSTALAPRIACSEIDLALVSRDRRGTVLRREPLVWVGAPGFETWRRDTLPIAVYEPGSQARKVVVRALRSSRREYRIVVSTQSLAGQIAAVESGVAVAALTRCSVPATLEILDGRSGLPSLPPIVVALLRSPGSRGDAAVDAMHAELISVLRVES